MVFLLLNKTIPNLWNLLKKADALPREKKVGRVAADYITKISFKTSNIQPQSTEITEVRRELVEKLRKSEEKSVLMKKFSNDEVYNALKAR